MKIFQKYYDSCDYLESLVKLDSPLEYMRERKPEDLQKYLLRMQDLLDRIGNPERDMKYIHVTGTAGKGTTTALIHHMLHNAGYKVGLTTSPATTTTLERIKVGDQYISPDDFNVLVERLKPIIADMYLNGKYGKPSYFDLILAIALMYFKQQECEYVVLEVGMGGRYDSTNVIPAPLISAITNIDLDHTHLLGDSKKDIAYEKAGIIKPGSVFFTTENHSEVLEMFENICKEQEVPYHHISAPGNPNNNLVYAIGRYLGVEKSIIEKTINELQLPCRFEIMQNGPLVILDGAHNVSKVKFALEKLKDMSYKKLHVIFGAGETKDALGMIDEIVKYTQNIVVVPVVNVRGKSFSVTTIKKYLHEKYPDIQVLVNLDAKGAMEEVIQDLRTDDALLCIGSLYLTGSLRENWYSKEFILKNRKSF